MQQTFALRMFVALKRTKPDSQSAALQIQELCGDMVCQQDSWDKFAGHQKCQCPSGSKIVKGLQDTYTVTWYKGMHFNTKKDFVDKDGKIAVHVSKQCMQDRWSGAKNATLGLCGDRDWMYELSKILDEKVFTHITASLFEDCCLLHDLRGCSCDFDSDRESDVPFNQCMRGKCHFLSDPAARYECGIVSNLYVNLMWRSQAVTAKFNSDQTWQTYQKRYCTCDCR